MSRRTMGYIVLGGFEVAFDPMLMRETLYFAGRATVFPSSRRAKRAIQLTVRDRINLFGKNDIKFKIINCEPEAKA